MRAGSAFLPACPWPEETASASAASEQPRSTRDLPAGPEAVLESDRAQAADLADPAVVRADAAEEAGEAAEEDAAEGAVVVVEEVGVEDAEASSLTSATAGASNRLTPVRYR